MIRERQNLNDIVAESKKEMLLGRLGRLMDKVDKLYAGGYDVEKIGEIIRLIDYMKSLAESGKGLEPEEAEDATRPQRKIKSLGMAFELSPDHVFDDMIHRDMPTQAQRDLAVATDQLEIFLDRLVRDNYKGPVRKL